MLIGRIALLSAALVIPAIAHAESAPGWQKTLQGLFTGNQNQDDALRQAYERGYQRGRDDEARVMRPDRDRYQRGEYENDGNTAPYRRDQGYSGR